MKELTVSEILQLVYSRLRNSELADEVPTIYKFNHFLNPTGEFIVVAPLSNVVNDDQIATIVVNIYVPDSTPTIGNKEQRTSNDARLGALAKIALEVLRWYDTGQHYFFRVEASSIISEEEISYSFINMKVKFKNS